MTESGIAGGYDLVFLAQSDISGKKAPDVIEEIMALYIQGGITT